MIAQSRTYRPSLIARLFSSNKWKLTLDAVSGEIRMVPGGGDALHSMDVVSISSSKALLWHAVEIRSRGRTDILHGLTGEAAKRLVSDLHAFVNHHLWGAIGFEADNLMVVDAKLRAFTENEGQYLAHADLARIIASVPGRAANALVHPLLDPAFTPAKLKSVLPASFAILVDTSIRQRYNENFVASELIRFKAFFDDLDGRSLSDQQRDACIRLEDNNLLVASAGSGKSATMVGKVAYVLEKQLYRPEEMLVLAFNKSAADELQERIAKQIGVDVADLQCRVTTFHALGRAIIEEFEGQPPQLANWAEHPAGEARVIEQIIEELVHSDHEFARLWISLLILHPKADIPVTAFDNEADYRRYITDRIEKGRATIGSLAGVYVKSLQEQTIANWLWLNSVEFEYEKQILLEDEVGTIHHVHPDFYYPATGTIHEHFAINADGTSPFADYVQHADSKRDAYRLAEIDFFETTSAQANNGTFLAVLEAELTQREVPLVTRDLADIEEVLQPILIKHYHQLIGTCIKHIRANQLTLDMLIERSGSLHDKERAKVFARVVWEITSAYTRKLNEAGSIDFDSMIGDATHLIETGKYRSPYSLILVDEFQDISEPRANLIKALKQQNPFAKLFAVGDDWQSIYRFAGSDISIFTRFDENFGASWQGRLEQTYRCNQLIAETAAEFVQRNPEQLKKQVRSARAAIPKSIRVIPVDGERGRPDFGEACHQLLERLDLFLGSISQQWRTVEKDKLTVLVLWRYNQLDPFNGRWPVFENIKVSGMSFHRSKGLEADYTILLDVSEGDYGVPSRIEDDELLNLVIPRPETYPYAEERRLFYVALTRASRGVFLLTNARQPSRYIKELAEISGDDIRFETIEGKALHQCPSCLIGQMVERKTKAGRVFLGCNQFPDCRHTGGTRKA